MSRPGEPNPSTTNSLSFRLTAGRPDLQEMANTVGKLFSPSLPGVPAILPSAPLPAFSGACLRVSGVGARLVNWRFGSRTKGRKSGLGVTVADVRAWLQRQAAGLLAELAAVGAEGGTEPPHLRDCPSSFGCPADRSAQLRHESVDKWNDHPVPPANAALSGKVRSPGEWPRPRAHPFYLPTKGQWAASGD